MTDMDMKIIPLTEKQIRDGIAEIKRQDEAYANIHCSAQSGSRICDLSFKNRLKGVTRNGAYYALNDMTAKVVPLSVAERLHAALEKYRGQIDNEGKHSAADVLNEIVND